MMNATRDYLPQAIKSAIEQDDTEAAVALAGLVDGYLDVEIESMDGEAYALNGGDSPLWVVDDRRLLIDGVRVAEWTRCAMGDWGEAGRQCSDDEWCVNEDTNGGDRLPEIVEAVLGVLGLEDDIPDVASPSLATDENEPDSDGEYAVYWETVGDDAHVVTRYGSHEAAEAVCRQKNREFSARNPSSGGTTYLCGFGVRQLVDGKWQRVEAE